MADHKERKLIITPGLAREKIQAWCAYQERSQHETRQKLREYHLDEETTEALIAELIDVNFLNEERFALSFARGKFRIKHWGRNKIKAALRAHNISDYNLKNALQSLDESEYEKVLMQEAVKKTNSVKSREVLRIFYDSLKYLISRGFEADLVKNVLNEILNLKEHESRFEE